MVLNEELPEKKLVKKKTTLVVSGNAEMVC